MNNRDDSMLFPHIMQTEKGYLLTNQGKLNLEDALVRHDLDCPNEPSQSTVGLIVKALELRRERSIRPFSLMSCDNLPQNGSLTRAMVIGFIKAKGDESFALWAEKEVRAEA